MDGLDSLETLKVCIGYRVGAKKYEHVPSDIEVLARCEPVYAEFRGWRTPTDGLREWRKLPVRCRDYLKALAELSEAKLGIVSVGPARDQTIFV